MQHCVLHRLYFSSGQLVIVILGLGGDGRTDLAARFAEALGAAVVREAAERAQNERRHAVSGWESRISHSAFDRESTDAEHQEAACSARASPRQNPHALGRHSPVLPVSPSCRCRRQHPGSADVVEVVICFAPCVPSLAGGLSYRRSPSVEAVPTSGPMALVMHQERTFSSSIIGTRVFFVEAVERPWVHMCSR